MEAGQGESHDGYNGGSSKNEYSGKFGEKHVLNNSLWGTEYQSEEVEMQVNNFDFYKLQPTTSNHVSQICLSSARVYSNPDDCNLQQSRTS